MPALANLMSLLRVDRLSGFYCLLHHFQLNMIDTVTSSSPCSRARFSPAQRFATGHWALLGKLGSYTSNEKRDHEFWVVCQHRASCCSSPACPYWALCLCTGQLHSLASPRLLHLGTEYTPSMQCWGYFNRLIHLECQWRAQPSTRFRTRLWWGQDSHSVPRTVVLQ